MNAGRILLACVVVLCSASPAAAQTADVPGRLAVLLGLTERPAEAPDDYVRGLDDALAAMAEGTGLPAPTSTRDEMHSMIRILVPTQKPALRSDQVTLGFSVGAALFGVGEAPTQADAPVLFTDQASCEAQFPGETVVDFRRAEYGRITGYQCLREKVVGRSRHLNGMAWIDLPDRRIVTVIAYAVSGEPDEIAAIYPLGASQMEWVFDGQFDAVVYRLTRPSER